MEAAQRTTDTPEITVKGIANMIDKSEQNKTEMKETVNNWRKFKMQRAGRVNINISKYYTYLKK